MTDPTLHSHTLARTVQAERLRLHRAISASSVIFSVGMGALLAILLWSSSSELPLVLWLTTLGFALAARIAVWRAHVRADPQLADSARWLFRYRICFAAHGLAWSLAGLLLLPAASHSQFDLLSIALFAMSAGSLLATAFDVAAAAAFVIPTITPLLVHFFTRGDEGFTAIGAVMLFLAVSGMLSAWRTQGLVQESVRLRLAEEQSADEARRNAAQTEDARRELAEKHYLLPLLLRTTQQGFWYIDTAGLTIDLNPAMCGLLGRPREAVLGRSVFEFFDADNLRIMRDEIAARQTGKTGGYEIGITRPDGSHVHCFNNATPIHDGHGQRIGSIGLWTDISERKVAEQQLLETTEQLQRKSDELQLTLDNIDQGIVSADATSRIGVYNRRMLELLDLPESLLTPSATVNDIVRFQIQRGDIDTDGSFIDTSGVRQASANGGVDLPEVYVRRSRSGALIEVRRRMLPHGAQVRTFTDVTAYVGALETLRRRESEQRALLDAFPGYIAVIDEDFVYQHVNERLSGLMGLPVDQIAGRKMRDVLGQTAFEQLAPDIRRAAADQTTSVERHYPATPVRAQQFHELRYVAGPSKPGGKSLFYVFGNDITARKQAEAERLLLETQLQESRKLEAIATLEAQLRESQKMEAIGTLAGGIAHDFNNIIATILGNAELARQDMQAHAEALESLDEIRKAASRARDLVQQILSFSRRQPTARKRIPLAPVINESLRLLRATVPARVALEAHLDPGVPAVLADATQMEQVLINLVANAAQAMRGRPGRVDIRLGVVPAEVLASATQPALRALIGRYAGQIVQLSVSDDGPGMPPETLARVFEPFFTTKPVGEGTGLGLSVVHGIVHGHDGEIVVDSTPGNGTSFVLYLPAGVSSTANAADSPAAQPSDADATAMTRKPEARTTGGPGPRLLYIDDEEALVFLVKRVLERRGWRVGAHVNQRDALDALRADPAAYDLLITDYNMPGMSGLDVARAAHLIRPDLPVVIASGFIDEELRTHATAAGVQELIFKTSALEDFCGAIQALAGKIPASAMRD